MTSKSCAFCRLLPQVIKTISHALNDCSQQFNHKPRQKNFRCDNILIYFLYGIYNLLVVEFSKNEADLMRCSYSAGRKKRNEPSVISFKAPQHTLVALAGVRCSWSCTKGAATSRKVGPRLLIAGGVEALPVYKPHTFHISNKLTCVTSQSGCITPSWQFKRSSILNKYAQTQKFQFLCDRNVRGYAI